MRKFIKGDILVYSNKPTQPYKMSACLGALAIATEDEADGYVNVRWMDEKTSGDQMNGRYSPTRFRFANRDEVLAVAKILDAETRRVSSWTAPTPPIKEGDRVKNTNGSVGTVLAIRTFGGVEHAWVVWPTTNNSWRIENLTLVEEKKDCDC